MGTDGPAFVFVHGAWHNKSAWNLVTDELVDRGYATATLDLPGAGAHAKKPESFSQRPLDAAAFGTVPSPNAGVTGTGRWRSVSGDQGTVRHGRSPLHPLHR